MPFLLAPMQHPTPIGHAAHLSAIPVDGSVEAAVTATMVHSIGYLAITAIVAVAVYERLGVAILRRVWVNVDLVWAVALIATGILTVTA